MWDMYNIAICMVTKKTSLKQEVEIVKTSLNDYNIVKLEKNGLNKRKSKLLEI